MYMITILSVRVGKDIEYLVIHTTSDLDYEYLEVKRTECRHRTIRANSCSKGRRDFF